MTNEIAVSFPENLQVAASFDGFTVLTDQPEKSGGDNAAPSPSQLFATSIATCAGYFALKFCRSRGIDTATMRLKMTYAWDPDQKRWPKMSIELQLPEGEKTRPEMPMR